MADLKVPKNKSKAKATGSGSDKKIKDHNKSSQANKTAGQNADPNNDNTRLDPAVVKLIEYAKEKKSIFFEELADYLPEHIANTDKIEQVLALLAENNIQVVEEDLTEEDSPEQEGRKAESEKKRLVYSEKESSVDDPIRLYLREIGRENLLTAEQEIHLSKQMEDGENIIKGVIKKSGMIIPEFYHIAQKAFSKKDLRELNLSKKEITEHMTER